MVLIVAGAAIAVLAQGIWRSDTRSLRLGLLLLCATVLTPAARHHLGPVAASVQGLTLFGIAQLAYNLCERADLPASYAGGELPPRRWIPIAGVLVGSAAVDVALFAALGVAGTSLDWAPLIATMGTLCTIAIAGLVWALAMRTPPAN